MTTHVWWSRDHVALNLLINREINRHNVKTIEGEGSGAGKSEEGKVDGQGWEGGRSVHIPWGER